MLNFLYRTAVGRGLLKVLCQPWIPSCIGRFLDTRASACLISGFVRKNGIDLSEYETEGWKSFNDCFARKIRPGKREFPADETLLCAPCDGLLSTYRISDLTVLPVKQSRYTISALLRDEKLAEEFTDGYCLVYRLCVNHYHRYAYFDHGTKGANHFLPGILHTVRPIALRSVPVFTENAREYTVIETEHFGKIIQMEVGALLVGQIVNLHGAGPVLRGTEKGCFRYGGSTIIVLLPKDSVQLTRRIGAAADTGEELPVKMGEVVGRCASSEMPYEKN